MANYYEKSVSNSNIEIVDVHLYFEPVDAPKHWALHKPMDKVLKTEKVISEDKFTQAELCEVIEEVLKENNLLEDPSYPITAHSEVRVKGDKIVINCGTVAYSLFNKIEIPEDAKNGHLWMNLTIEVSAVKTIPITTFKK